MRVKSSSTHELPTEGHKHGRKRLNLISALWNFDIWWRAKLPGRLRLSSPSAVSQDHVAVEANLGLPGDAQLLQPPRHNNLPLAGDQWQRGSCQDYQHEEIICLSRGPPSTYELLTFSSSVGEVLPVPTNTTSAISLLDLSNKKGHISKLLAVTLGPELLRSNY